LADPFRLSGMAAPTAMVTAVSTIVGQCPLRISAHGGFALCEHAASPLWLDLSL